MRDVMPAMMDHQAVPLPPLHGYGVYTVHTGWMGTDADYRNSATPDCSI